MEEHLQDVTEVTTEAQLRALAHPLRMRLLAILRSDGPSTASRLAERVDESSGVTSYHLRRLASAGFVRELEDRGTRRERWWEAAKRITSYSPARFIDSPKTQRLSSRMRREILRFQQIAAEQYLVEEVEWGAEWADAAGASDLVIRLTPARLEELSAELMAIVGRYYDDPTPHDDPDGADVLVLLNAFPFRELPL